MSGLDQHSVDSHPKSLGTLEKLDFVGPLAVNATLDGIGSAASDAWHHPLHTAGELGVAAVIGASFASMQAKAGLPRLAIELGSVALGASSIKAAVKHGASGFGAISDVWHSPSHAGQDRQKIASSFGPLVFDTALMTAGAMAGAGFSRTVPVALKEKSILSDLNNYHAESAEHSARVGAYTELTAKQLGTKFGVQREAMHAGLMHDAGKLDLPMSLLGKTEGPFTAPDWDIIHQHPLDSFDRLQKVPYKGALQYVPEDASTHHEWVNGEGYPNGLTGDQMRLAARIVPPSDVFDAVTAGRAYMGRMPLGEVKEMMDGGKGTHFDPDVLDAFWKIPADKAINVLESGPKRTPLSAQTLKEFRGTTIGRVIDVINGAPADARETRLAGMLNQIYLKPVRNLHASS